MFSEQMVRIFCVVVFVAAVDLVGQDSESDSPTYTLEGVCVEEKSKIETPLIHAELTLLYVDRWAVTQEIVATTKTNMRGEFRFDGLKKPVKSKKPLPAGYVLLGRSDGFATVRMSETAWRNRENKATLKFGRPRKLVGRITDKHGNPIEGLGIYHGVYLVKPVAGYSLARTNTNGDFALNDLPQIISMPGERFTRTTILRGIHPKYGQFNVYANSSTRPANMSLGAAYQVEGKVIDVETGVPRANCVVVASIARGRLLRRMPYPIEGASWVTTRTDKNGNYRLNLFHESSYNLFSMDDNLVAKAISVSNPKNEESVRANFELDKPIKVNGQLIDFATGKPLANAVRISWHGPDRPKYGSPVNGVLSNPDGSFTLNMVAGTNWPYVSSVDDKFRWKSMTLLIGDEKVDEIDVAAGQELDLKIVVKQTKR